MKISFAVVLSALTLSLGLSFPVFAGPKDVVVEGAWARASIGTSRPSAAYMTIRNENDVEVTLTGLRTDLAMMSEIHRTTTNDQGVSSMAPAGEIVISAGETIELKPGGLHVMLMKLQQPMTEGESFPLTLVFSGGGEVTVDVPILGLAARGPEN